jgi:hypothetical protein
VTSVTVMEGSDNIFLLEALTQNFAAGYGGNILLACEEGHSVLWQ